MPVFHYVTKDLQGNEHKGEIESIDEHSAIGILRHKKLIVISIISQEEKKPNVVENFFNRVSFSDLVIMTRQLSTMISSGLVLSESLDILSDQQVSPKFKATLEKISSDIKGGLDFGTALEKHPDIFPRLYVNLVKAGEASGKLDTILLQLALHLEKDRDFKSKVKGAMIYPVIVISMMFLVMLVMVFFVMPRLTNLFKQSNIELPLPTKILLFSSNIIINYWWVLLLLSILLFLATRSYATSVKGRLYLDKQALRLPAIGRIVSIVTLTNFTRTFGLLIAAGIPMLDAIKISQDVLGNQYYRLALQTAYLGVERGLSFSSQLLAQPIFPKIVGHMVKTGEETGKLDEVLLKLADYFESESDNALRNITTLIEPLILLILGVGVALLVLSVILPIYKLTTSVG